jgi:acetylornithine/N-succinyldiaminopimelate aminotransferase
MSNDAVVQRGRQVLFPNYKQNPIALVRGLGARVWDADGKEYIDWLGGVATLGLGHAHPAVRAAVEAQLGRLWHVSNHYYNEPSVALAERLVRDGHAQRVFFCNSGTEANEGAIKLVRRWHHDKGTGRFEILCAQDSFHGRTMGSLAATGQPKYHEGFAPMLPGFRHLPFGDLDAFARAIGPQTAAIMVECVQGESGVVIPPAGFVAGLRKLCDDHGLLLVLDEVQGGFGRTGRMWSFEWEGVSPDVFTVAKAIGNGLPLGALCAKAHVAEALQPGTHGSTYGGNPVAAAGACAVYDELHERGAMARGADGAARLVRKLGELKDASGGLVTEVRGRGMWVGVVLADERAGKVLDQARLRGLLVNAIGGRILRFAPSLLITDQEIDEGVARLAAALEATRA